MFHGEGHSVRAHDLLEIDAKQLLSCQASAPQWVEGELRESPFAVVRRGSAPGHEIPIGVRGTGRNQRWAAFCHSKLVNNILTPSQLLTRAIPSGFFGVLFGKGFDATPEVASSSLIASTLLSIFTLAGWIVLLSHLH